MEKTFSDFCHSKKHLCNFFVFWSKNFTWRQKINWSYVKLKCSFQLVILLSCRFFATNSEKCYSNAKKLYCRFVAICFFFVKCWHEIINKISLEDSFLDTSNRGKDFLCDVWNFGRIIWWRLKPKKCGALLVG